MSQEPSPTPRWVKVLGIVAAVLVLLVIVANLIGGGEHEPGRHSLGAVVVSV
jgi:hypothetical protein